jgi:hypothetical protein
MFAEAWCEKYGQRTYAGTVGNPRHEAELAAYLHSLTKLARLEAQGRAGAIIAEYLGDDSPGRVRGRHPFTFFVRDFQALSTRPAPPGRKPAKTSAYCELHQKAGTHEKLPRAGPLAGCPHCKHVEASRRRRSSDPSQPRADEFLGLVGR